MSDTIDLLYRWRNDGLTPLVLIKGYSEVFLEGKLGALTNQQREAMETINRCCHEAIESWYDFSSYFHLWHPDEEIARRLSKITNEELIYIREHIFDKAFASLQTLENYARLFQKEKLGILTDEQREAMEVMNHRCRIAIDRWHQPSNYFDRHSVKLD